MALTAQDKAFLDKQKAKGLPFEEAWAKLSAVKEKLGLTGGTFMTRAASVAENSVAPQAVQDKATAAKEDIQAQGSEYAKKPSLVEETVEAVGNIKNPQIQAIVGAGQGIAESSLNLLGMGEKASNYLMGNKDVPTLSETILESETGKKLLTPQNQTQSASKFLGEVATPLALGSPVTGALRGAGSAKAAALGGGRLTQAITAGAAASPVETALVTAGMEGRAPKKEELGIGLAIDTLLPVAGVALKGGGRFINKIVKTFQNGELSPMAIDVANTVAKSDDASKSAFLKMGDQYMEYMKNPTKVSSPLADVGQKISDDFTSKILPEREAIGKELKNQILEADNLAQAGGGQTSEQIVKTLTDGLEDINVKVTDSGLDFSGSTIRFSDDNQKTLTKVFNDVKRLTETGSFVPPSEKWTLAQALDDLSEYNSKLASQTTTEGELPLIELKMSLTQDVKNSLSESGQAVDLFDQYTTLSKIRDVLNRRLGEGGEGGFGVTKSLFGEQKFGTEVKEALSNMSARTGVDYLEQARWAKAAGEAAGDDQAKSLLTTTSTRGFIQKAVEDTVFDKTRIFEKIKASLDKDKVKYSQPLLEKIASATLKAAGVNISD